MFKKKKIGYAIMNNNTTCSNLLRHWFFKCKSSYVRFFDYVNT